MIVMAPRSPVNMVKMMIRRPMVFNPVVIPKESPGGRISRHNFEYGLLKVERIGQQDSQVARKPG